MGGPRDRNESTNHNRQTMKKMTKAELSRQGRRHRKIVVGGKEVEIVKYLREQAKRLPPMKDKLTGGNLVNHADALYKIYMEGGKSGVDEYLNVCHYVYLRDGTRYVPVRKYAMLWLRFLQWRRDRKR